MRNALESEEFDLHYQPLFNLKTKRIMTCEALLRWPHRERGMVYPAEFIPVAEEMGLIVEIGNQALYKACLECGQWPGDTTVAVNLSSIQFDRSNVPALVRETLAATNLPAHRLEIEITESTLLQNTRSTRADLHQLVEFGVKISLDDFGTAYSSFSYLHSFPLHKVKIDQSFLQGLGDDERRVTLLRGMTRLSAQLGLKRRGRRRRDPGATRTACRRRQHRRSAGISALQAHAGGRSAEAALRILCRSRSGVRMVDTAPERCSVRPKECQRFILSHLLPDRRNRG